MSFGECLPLAAAALYRKVLSQQEVAGLAAILGEPGIKIFLTFLI